MSDVHYTALIIILSQFLKQLRLKELLVVCGHLFVLGKLFSGGNLKNI